MVHLRLMLDRSSPASITLNLDVAKEDTVPGYRFRVVDGPGLLAGDFEKQFGTDIALNLLGSVGMNLSSMIRP
jgi:hypothetical protein